MIATAVPVAIDADAQKRIDQLGRQKELEEMLDHATLSISPLVRLEVSCPPSYEHDDDMIVIDAFGPWQAEQLRQVGDEYFRWIVKTFPPEVYGDFLFITNPVDNNEVSAFS